MDTLHIRIKFIHLSRLNSLLKPLAEFLAPCRLVLHGLGLAIGALSLILCALFIQIGVREFLAPHPSQSARITSPTHQARMLYQPITTSRLTPWAGTHLQNQCLLAQIMANRRRQLYR